MAKLTDLPEALTLPTNAKVYVVDTDDVTDDPAGSSKQIDASLLGGGAVPAASKILLQEIDLSVSGEFDFTAIPAGYDRLIIEGHLVSVGTNSQASILVNGDAVLTNYVSQIHYTANLTTSTTAQIVNNSWAGYVADTGFEGAPVRYVIENYEATGDKYIRCQGVGRQAGPPAQTRIADSVIEWQGGAAVTALKILEYNGGSLLGKLQLFGERAITLDGGGGGGVSKTILTETRIDKTVLSGATYDLAIPSGYDRIIVRGQVTNNSGTDTQLWMYLNGDYTASNYFTQRNGVINAVARNEELSEPELALMPSTTSPAGARTDFEAVIANPDGSQIKRWSSVFTRLSAVDNGAAFLVSSGHTTLTAAVTAIRIESHLGLDTLTGFIEVIGVKEETVGGLATQPAGTVVKEEIARITDPGTGGFNFTGIPQIYDRLWVCGTVQSSAGAALNGVNCELNDVTSGYHRQTSGATNGAAATSESATADMFYIGGSSAPTTSTITALIENPTSAVPKVVRATADSVDSSSSLFEASVVGYTPVTAAVTSLRISAIDDPVSTVSGTLILYGEKTV